MAKRKHASAGARKDSERFRPGLSAAERRENARKARARYYARNAEAIREKKRVGLAGAAAAKVNKRRWDPPKRLPSIQEVSDQGRPQSSNTLDPDLLTDEILNASLHFKDPRGATTSSDEDSAFRRVDMARHHPTASSESNVAPESIGARAEERVAIEVLATMRVPLADPRWGGSQDSVLNLANQLSSEDGWVLFLPYIQMAGIHADFFRDSVGVNAAVTNARVQKAAKPGPLVQAALEKVAHLNETPLTPPTSREASRWVRREFGFWGQYLQYRPNGAIKQWREAVFQATHCTDKS
ncbi:hypothetical protein B0H11DRAFT_1929874 [Mycena galericulata]|nr:hypothetical protein B0H11DRAFT_1929874 [Mycena galericulata]